jgi:hypothetical protein
MDVVPAFVDETGVLTTPTKNQPVYGIGLLLVHDPARVTDSFYKLHFNLASSRAKQRSQLRHEIKQGNRSPSLSEVDRLMWSTRHHEYKFSDVTSHNLQHYIDLLNLYFSFDCFEFHALLMDRTEPGFNLSQWNNDSWRAYVELGCELLRRRLNRQSFTIVDLQGQPNGASISVEEAFSSVEKVSGCLRASSETQVFLQVVDVLLGCVQADWKDRGGFYVAGSKRAEAKRGLVNFMRTRLELPPGEPIVSHSRPVWERGAPSPFTVWLKSRSAAMSGVHPG